MNDFGPVGIYEFFSVERAFSGGLVAGLYPQNPLVHYQAIAYRIYDLKIGTRTSFSLVNLVFPLQYHTTIAPYFSFILLLTKPLV